MAAWCQLKKISQSELRTIVDDLHTFFRQLGKYLHDPEGRLQKIFAFGTTSLRTLFTGIPLQELTGNVNLKDLFGFRDKDLKYFVEKLVPESRKEKFMNHLRRACRQYSFFDQSGEATESIFFPHEIISQMRKTFYGVTHVQMPNGPSQNYSLAKAVRDTIRTQFQSRRHFAHHNLHVFQKHSIDLAHLFLDANDLSPTLLKSLLVDFGFYKATEYNAGSKGYIPHRDDLLPLPEVCGLL